MAYTPQTKLKTTAKQSKQKYTFSQNCFPDSEQQSQINSQKLHSHAFIYQSNSHQNIIIQQEIAYSQKLHSDCFIYESDSLQNIIIPQEAVSDQPQIPLSKPQRPNQLRQQHSYRNIRQIKGVKDKSKGDFIQQQANYKRSLGSTSFNQNFQRPFKKNKIKNDDKEDYEDFNFIPNEGFQENSKNNKVSNRTQKKDRLIQKVLKGSSRKDTFIHGKELKNEQKSDQIIEEEELKNKLIKEQLKHKQNKRENTKIYGKQYLAGKNQLAKQHLQQQAENIFSIEKDDLEFKDLKSIINLIYKNKEISIRTVRVRYLVKNKQLEQKMDSKEQKTVDKRFIIQGTFCLSKKELQQINWEIFGKNFHSYTSNCRQQSFKNQSEESDENYFKVYLNYQCQVKMSSKKQQKVEKDLVLKTSDEKDKVNLFKSCIEQFQYTNQQLHNRFIESLMVLRQKSPVHKDLLIQKGYMGKQCSIELALLMFQDSLSEDFKAKIFDKQWREVSYYYKKMISIYKNLDDIIYCSSPNIEKVKKFQSSYQNLKIFIYYFTLNAFNPQEMKRHKKQLALKVWNQFRQIYLVSQNFNPKNQSNTTIQYNNHKVSIPYTNQSSIKNNQSHNQEQEQKTLNSKLQTQAPNIIEADRTIIEKYSPSFLSPHFLSRDEQNKEHKNELQIIVDFLFDQNLAKARNLLKFVQKENQQKKESRSYEQWTQEQNRKFLFFVILHHREVFKDSASSYGMRYLISKTIQTKNSEQCGQHVKVVFNYRKKKQLQKNQVKEVINALILKYRIKETQIIKGIGAQIDLPPKQLFLDFTKCVNDMIYLSKYCQTQINSFIGEYLEKKAFQIDFK